MKNGYFGALILWLDTAGAPPRIWLHAAPWARSANFVKNPPPIVKVIHSELNGSNAIIWDLVYQTPKSHNALIDIYKFIRYVQINTSMTIQV